MMLVILCVGTIFAYLTAITYYFWNLTRPDDILSLSGSWTGFVSGCYYINLDQHPERRTYMDKQLSSLNIPYERISGTDGEQATQKYPDVMISEKNIGIKLSHIEALGKSKKHGWTIVFEDDIVIKENRIVKYLDCIPVNGSVVHFGMDPLTVLWSLLTFRFGRVTNGVWSISCSKKKCDPYPARCSYAYAVTRTGAEKWLQEIETNFYEFPLNKHGFGVDTVYICHNIVSVWDIWKVLTLKQMSYVYPNKNQFGYVPHADTLV